MLDSVIKYYYIIPIVSFLIIVVTFSINHWDMKEIEKKVITRFRRFQIEVSLIFIETITVGIVFAVFLNKNLIKPFEGIENMYEKIFLIVICLFCLTLPFIVIVNGAIGLIKWLTIPKVSYYVDLYNSNEKWILEKATVRGQILLRNDNNDCVFLKEWDKLEFKKDETVFPRSGKWIYKDSKTFNLIMLGLTLSLFSLIAWSFFIDKESPDYTLHSSVLLMTTLFLTTIYFSLLKIKKMYI